MLETRGLVMRFGGLVAVDGVDLDIAEGEMRCIIGPNGAGKTTLFNILTGDLKPSQGEVRLEGRRIDRLPVYRIARLGIARKFQVPSIYGEMTVFENLATAADGTRALLSLLRHRRDREEELSHILDEVGLADQRETPAAHLGHGQTQRLEIGMVLVNRPRLLLLDEPTAGMTLEETSRTADLLKALARERNLTMVVVEHDIDFIRMIGDRITVLYEGRVLIEGHHTEIEKSEEVRRVYLGEEL
jgi:urea transport system ATP-binding protein